VSRGPAIPLLGGLDLTTPSPMTRPGTLADCLNYEVASRRGYTRIDGFERFDGRPGVAEFRVLLLTTSGITGSMAVGDLVQFAEEMSPQPHQGITGYVTDVSADEQPKICVVFAGGMADPALPDQLEAPVVGATATVTAYASLDTPIGTQEAFDDALYALAVARRAEIVTVPGRGGSDVLGGFLFNNRNYAIRDLPRVYFEGGYYTDADEGLRIEIDSEFYEILEVRVLGDNAGFIAYDPVPSPGAVATGIGSPTLTSLPVSGAFSSGFDTIPYSDGLSVSGGVAPYSWSLAEDDVGTPAPGEIVDLSEFAQQSEVTPAALWRSSSSGWERVDLGREMGFISGTDGLASTPRATNLDASDIKATDWIYPGTSEIDGVAATDLAADDTVTDAIAGASGQTLWCRDFDFSSIPAGAEVIGVEVSIKRTTTAAGVARDAVVILTGITGGTENKASGRWDDSGVLTVETYGGSSDLWGSENIGYSTISDPSFGVLFLVEQDDPPTALDATIDYVAIKIHYAERGGIPIYVWDGTTDVEMTVINVQILTGDSGQGSGAGFVTLTSEKNADKPRLVNVGDEIRNAPAGGGDIIGIVSSRDRPIFLPGQFEIDNNRSQYDWFRYNFFGQDRYSAMYGVSGAGPAMAFDGTNLIKIRTPLAPGVDVPRHIAQHGTMLAIGYFSGAVLFSAVGAPYETRGAFGATAVETGDRLTGLAPGGGDALIVIGEETTSVIRGLSPAVFSKSIISPRRGAVEYTLADPGRALIADNFGIFAADTPESFAAASRNYLSATVEPWLRERLQATISNEQRFLRPVCALAVRSKQQYRIFFRDGAVLTMTAVEEGIEITRQRLYIAGTPDVALVVRRAWSGVDASGRERLFITFTGAKEGYVFELDVGRSFDGEAIPARLVINPYSAGALSQLKQYDRFFFGGSGGYASLTWSRGINGQYPEGAELVSQLGTATQPATPQNGSRRSSKMGAIDMPTECYDIMLQVESLTNREAPHTLQYIEPFISARGDSRGHTGDT